MSPACSVVEACESCLRRSWLLGELSAVLDRNCRADGRLFELLALEDEHLIAALGGRRRLALEEGHAAFRSENVEFARGSAAICMHDDRYPKALRGQGAPRLLHVSGGLDRLQALTKEAAVALIGTGCASDYGLEIAREIARELAASGVTLVTERRAGIALAAQEGAVQAGGATVSISGDGLGAPAARTRRATYERLARTGCVVSELPGASRGRRWGAAAGSRIAAALGGVTVVVEAEETPIALRGARLAQSLDRPLGALPGPVGSRASSGCHMLLREGARLVRDASDVIDLLYGVDGTDLAGRVASTALPRLGADLRTLLARVGAGASTLGELTAGERNRVEVLRDLGELELMGLLARGDGGSYVLGTAQRRRLLR